MPLVRVTTNGAMGDVEEANLEKTLTEDGYIEYRFPGSDEVVARLPASPEPPSTEPSDAS